MRLSCKLQTTLSNGYALPQIPFITLVNHKILANANPKNILGNGQFHTPPPPRPLPPFSLHVFIENLHGIVIQWFLRCFSDWIKATNKLRWCHILTGAVCRRFYPARDRILSWNFNVRSPRARGGGRGYSQKYRVGVCGPFPKTFTLFKIKICDFSYPNYDLI